MNVRPELLVVGGAGEARRFSVGEGGVRLGRSSSNDIHVPDEELSRNHCLFEVSGASGIRVTDLASANGTFVNGVQLGVDAMDLKVGDVITVGATKVRVVAPGAPLQENVDLGLDAGASAGPAEPGDPAVRRRPSLANVLWISAAAVLVAAIFVVLEWSGLSAAKAPETHLSEEPVRKVVEMRYEVVDAGPESMYRYYLTLSEDGALSVEVDDVPVENRHVKKFKNLDEKSLARINSILLDPDLDPLDSQYVGPDPEPPALKSHFLTVVYSDGVKTVSVANTHQGPDAFSRLVEKLETFARSELGMWAMQMSSAQLVQKAAEKGELAARKWEDREAAYGNIYAAVRAYHEAIACLDTVNPKPPEFEAYRKGLQEAEKELESRCSDQRIKAERFINLSDWESARVELQVLCQMVPDRDDQRNRDASDKLVEVESRIRKGGQR